MVYFVDEHDFRRYPELTNNEIQEIGFLSPHEQIMEDFQAHVVRVHDGDTVTLRCDFRDFDFPLRFASIDAPELSTGVPGLEARDFLRFLLENEDVEVRIDYFNRVDKYGRLLGEVMIGGQVASDIMVQLGYATPYTQRLQTDLPDLNKVFAVNQWF